MSFLVTVYSFPEQVRAEAPRELLPPPSAVANPIASTNDPIDQQIVKRRRLLQVHQGLGLATVGMLAATTIVGQLNYNDVIDGAASDKYQLSHKVLAGTAAALFAASAFVAYIAPTPFKKDSSHVDTATIHKWSMALAALGIIAQVALGVKARSSRGSAGEESFSKTHLAVGYTTLGFAAIGTGVLFF